MTIDKKAVGERIKSIRLSLGMTSEQFAEMLTPPASKGTVSKWENGRYIPNNKRLVTIADLGGISVEDLLYGSLCTWEILVPGNEFYMYHVATGCGVGKDLITNEPIPKDYKYCPYCGKELVVDGEQTNVC